MRILFIAGFFLALASQKANAQAGPEKRKADEKIAVALVEEQLQAYNKRDIEAFLAPYSDSVELYEFPNTLIGKGKDGMRKEYGSFFRNTPKLHCEIKSRVIQGNTVIDKEHVTGMGDRVVEALAIYQIENGKIRRVYFVE